MAFLDVSEVIRDPLFTSEVTIQAFGSVYDEMGNPLWTVTDEMTVQAVVTSDSKPLERLPDGHRRGGGIKVRFVVSDVPPEFEGRSYDRVVWRGDTFVVNHIHDNTQFGRGFMTLECVPEEPTDGSSSSRLPF